MPRRRPVAGGLLAVSGLLALVAGLAAIDSRVREELTRLAAGGLPSEVATASLRGQELLAIVMQAVKDQSAEHAPLVIFSIAAMVLVVFMLRS